MIFLSAFISSVTRHEVNPRGLQVENVFVAEARFTALLHEHAAFAMPPIGCWLTEEPQHVLSYDTVGLGVLVRLSAEYYEHNRTVYASLVLRITTSARCRMSISLCG